ncbi:unnamed protein product [Hydatigera taeniaeformis]|uniref:Ovule protein n=1 Tax=Hydatigena taeniaeformis TaxID=6205 RepID=A0A0R3WNR8_HYDTA|nr:unnamed protein product [Hydatigera taeniaeformis]
MCLVVASNGMNVVKDHLSCALLPLPIPIQLTLLDQSHFCKLHLVLTSPDTYTPNSHSHEPLSPFRLLTDSNPSLVPFLLPYFPSSSLFYHTSLINIHTCTHTLDNLFEEGEDGKEVGKEGGDVHLTIEKVYPS